MVILCFTFWGTANFFSTVATPLYITASKTWGFQFICIVLTLFSACFSFILAILVTVKWCLVVVMISISLRTNDVEIFSGVYWFFVCLHRRHVHPDPLPIFKFFFKLLSCKCSLHILDTNLLCDLQLFSPILSALLS